MIHEFVSHPGGGGGLSEAKLEEVKRGLRRVAKGRTGYPLSAGVQVGGRSNFQERLAD